MHRAVFALVGMHKGFSVLVVIDRNLPAPTGIHIGFSMLVGI